jgi:Uma2 family endonuclease
MLVAMTSATIPKELFEDDVHRYELVDGELREKPMVSIFHSLLLIHLGHLLLNRLEELGKAEQFWVLGDPLAKIREDHWRRPDLAVIKAENAEAWKYVMPGHWPELCIEIVSVPKQSVDEILDKCKLYHAQGVPHCWVLEPESRTAWNYHAAHAQPEWVAGAGVLSAPSIGLEFHPDELWRGLHNKRGKEVS